MTILKNSNKGFALVSALVFITILAVIATVSIWIASSEKRVTFNEQIHQSAFYAADAGGEAGINWVRIQNSPPSIIAPGNVVYDQINYTALDSKQDYKFNATFLQKRLRPGWSTEYKDFDYLIISDGSSVRDTRSQLELSLSRLFKEGY
ncbi:MAG: hypothetical protein GTO51_07105 [Candidatus Latescibacteria bacterium]|nr:hypothetical protein [Candidatus Latescibacterota bacterium]NIM65740.1 hypothetical protein [Candidatus Latescibacterota bacterium]NIO02125.1 hypothetical protein [Candidatus Latescibacterota bacterium]NIO28957.1 hypothetical protein [Candidatus Latescibacterota bacterium]NIO56581.1 hypothetical protein [Candidatus Latescibacterota bacterium]